MSEEFTESDQAAVEGEAANPETNPDGGSQQPEEKDEAKQSALAQALSLDDKPVENKSEAPEKYELNIYDSKDFDDKSYADAAKNLGLSQEAAQKILDVVLPTMEEKRKARAESQEKAFVDALESDLKGDAEIGGANLDSSLKLAAKAVKKFGTPEMLTILQNSPVSSHPEFVRFFARVGKVISEDTFVAEGAKPTTANDLGKSMYKDLDKIFQ